MLGSVLSKPALEMLLGSARAWLTAEPVSLAAAQGCFKNPFAPAALCQCCVFNQPPRLLPSSLPEQGRKPTRSLQGLARRRHTPAAPSASSPSRPIHPIPAAVTATARTVPAAPCRPPLRRDQPRRRAPRWLPAAIPAWPPWVWRAWALASRPRHGRSPAAHRQEVAAEVEGRLFMLFFLYKSGRGWTIPDRTSCVCCALITGAARRTNTAALRPEGERGRGAAPLHRAHWGWPRGAEMGRRQPRIPGDTGRERAARLRSLPAPHTRPKMAAAPHPPASLAWGTFRQPPPQPPLAPPQRGRMGGASGDPRSARASLTARAKHGGAGGHLLKRGPC